MLNAFANYKIEKPKVISERAELLSYFVENLRNKDGKKFQPRVIAIKLSHIPTKDLYYIVSIFKDTLGRKGLDGASKEFWWSIKAK